MPRSAQRGEVPDSTLAPHVVATVHPSSILRQATDDDRRRQRDRFVDDLRLVASFLESRE
jgi:DNA polymerase